MYACTSPLFGGNNLTESGFSQDLLYGLWSFDFGFRIFVYFSFVWTPTTFFVSLFLSFFLLLLSLSLFLFLFLPLSSFFFYFCLYLVVRDSVAGRLNIKDTRIRNGQPLSNAMTKRRGEEYRGETGKSSGEPRNRRISIDPIYRRCYRRRWLVQIVRVFRNTDTIRRGTTRYDTTRHDTQRFTFTGCVVKTDSRGLFENCMLVPAERCSGVPLY